MKSAAIGRLKKMSGDPCEMRSACWNKEIARQFNVPVMRNVPLAQALNKLDIGEEIPEDLYEAVAEVLNFVYELQQKKKI